MRLLKRCLIPGALLAVTVVVYGAASYPSAVKSFTTKVDGAGNTISAAHINDLQDEIVAIETALLSGLTHDLKPTVSGAENLGTSSLPWGTLYVNSIVGGFGADVACGRLTLTTGTPVTTTDVTAATSVYYAVGGAGGDDAACNIIALYDGSAAWNVRTYTEITISVPATTNTLYDVFLYDNAGTVTAETVAWTNDTTRATALTRQDGRLVKTGAVTRRYVGTFRTTGVSGQTEDSFAKRYVWNYYNRVERPMRVLETTNTWAYSTAAWQQANASAANQLDFVVGVSEDAIEAEVYASGLDGAPGDGRVSIGLDGTTGPATGCIIAFNETANTVLSTSAHLRTIPAAGRHYLTWLEYAGGTWHGDNGTTVTQSGIHGRVRS